MLTDGKGLDRAGRLRLDGDILDDLDDLRDRHSILDLLDAGCLQDLKAAAIGLAGAAATRRRRPTSTGRP